MYQSGSFVSHESRNILEEDELIMFWYIFFKSELQNVQNYYSSVDCPFKYQYSLLRIYDTLAITQQYPTSKSAFYFISKLWYKVCKCIHFLRAD